MGFLIDTAIGVGQIALGFYGFWFVWRVLAPVLPGPSEERERIANFACYFTDPLVVPLANGQLRRRRLISLGWLVLVAAGQVGLGRLATTI